MTAPCAGDSGKSKTVPSESVKATTNTLSWLCEVTKRPTLLFKIRLTGDALLENTLAAPDGQEAHIGAVRLLKYVQQYADFYRVMLGTKGDPFFLERFRQNLEKRFGSRSQLRRFCGGGWKLASCGG
jgi:hypothetical protein